MLAIVVALLTASCARYVGGTVVVAANGGPAVAISDAEQCTEVDAPLTTIPARNDREPVLRIPQPDGWERNTSLDSELVRFVLGNPSLIADDFVPNAVVGLESVRSIEDAELVFEQQLQGLESIWGATDLRVTEHTLCGLPAVTIDYQTPAMGNMEPHPAILVIAVLHTDDTTYSASVTVQTMDADNPIYRRDAETMVTGFQVLPPSPA